MPPFNKLQNCGSESEYIHCAEWGFQPRNWFQSPCAELRYCVASDYAGQNPQVCDPCWKSWELHREPVSPSSKRRGSSCVLGDTHRLSHLSGTWVDISPKTLLIQRQWGTKLVSLLSSGDRLSSSNPLPSGTNILSRIGFHSVAIERAKLIGFI